MGSSWWFLDQNHFLNFLYSFCTQGNHTQLDFLYYPKSTHPRDHGLLEHVRLDKKQGSWRWEPWPLEVRQARQKKTIVIAMRTMASQITTGLTKNNSMLVIAMGPWPPGAHQARQNTKTRVIVMGTNRVGRFCPFFGIS